jgi:hypothetical protein
VLVGPGGDGGAAIGARDELVGDALGERVTGVGYDVALGALEGAHGRALGTRVPRTRLMVAVVTEGGPGDGAERGDDDQSRTGDHEKRATPRGGPRCTTTTAHRVSFLFRFALFARNEI